LENLPLDTVHLGPTRSAHQAPLPRTRQIDQRRFEFEKTDGHQKRLKRRLDNNQ
jgi:hypothetical protein